MEKNDPKNDEMVRFRAEVEQLLGVDEPNFAPKHDQCGTKWLVAVSDKLRTRALCDVRGSD
jgi:hypothetical protein